MNLQEKIQAALTNDQKEKVRKWVKPKPKSRDLYRRNVKPISDHVFGNKTRITLPDNIEDIDDSSNRPDSRVHRFLYKEHHYTSDDYRKGIVYHDSDHDKKRPLKIGRLLEKLQAPDEIKQAYMNDPFRTGAKKKDLKITISRHPYDVAGMSTNRGWSSCMDMEEGSNRDLLPKDIEQGTHVAYLHPENDKTISKPSARVALKPYGAKGKKTILRSEGRVYGTASNRFEPAVSAWAEQHFPQEDNVIYTKNQKLYDDNSPRHIVHITSVPSLLRKNSLNKLANVSSNTFKSHQIKYDEIKHLLPKIDHNNSSFLRYNVLPSSPKEDYGKYATHSNPHVRASLIKAHHWRELDKETKRKLLRDKDPIVKDALIDWGIKQRDPYE